LSGKRSLFKALRRFWLHLRGAKEAGQMLAAQSDEKMKTKDSKDLNNYKKKRLKPIHFSLE
jgi:hypothetical protein